MESRSINDQILQIRQELSARFDNDLDAILTDIRTREAVDGRKYVTLAPRRILSRTGISQESGG